MNRRKFMGLMGVVAFGVPAIAGAKKRPRADEIAWQGSPDESFVCYEKVGYITTVGDNLVFTGKPKHKYVRFMCDSPTKIVVGDHGSMNYSTIRLTRKSVLSLDCFDWERYKKRMANTCG